MRVTRIIAAAALALSFVLCTAYAKQASDFTDFSVDKGYGALNEHWGLDDIEYLLSKNAIAGVPDGSGVKFEADRSITRSEFAAMIVRLLDPTGKKTQTAVDNSEGYMTAKSMKEKGFSWETETLAAVYYYGGGAVCECVKAQWDKPVRRSEMAFMAIKLSEGMNGASYSKLDGIEKTFSDLCDVKNNLWAEEICLAASSGIMSGNEEGMISPADTATRAEACAIAARLTDASRRKTVDMSVDRSEKIFNRFITTEFINKPLEYVSDAYGDGCVTAKQSVINKFFVDMNNDGDKELVLTSESDAKIYNVSSVWDIDENGDVFKLWAADGSMGRCAIRYSVIEYEGEIYLDRTFVDNNGFIMDGISTRIWEYYTYLYKYTDGEMVLAKTIEYTKTVDSETGELYESKLILDGVEDNSLESSQRYYEIRDKMILLYLATTGEYYMGLNSKLREVTNEPIVKICCDDFDKNGSYEAFIFTGELDYNRYGADAIIGDVWFATDDNIQNLTDNSDNAVIYDEKSPSVIKTEDKTIFYYNYTNKMKVYSVNEGELVVNNLNGWLSGTDDINNLKSTISTYDGMVTKTDFENQNFYGMQYTDKNYWFFIDKTDWTMKEYGAVEISMKEFLKFDGAEEVIEQIDGKIYNILYRENGIININVFEEFDEEYYTLDNIVVICKDSKVKDYYKSNGIYLAASNPEIAVYPEKNDFN